MATASDSVGEVLVEDAAVEQHTSSNNSLPQRRENSNEAGKDFQKIHK